MADADPGTSENGTTAQKGVGCLVVLLGFGIITIGIVGCLNSMAGSRDSTAAREARNCGSGGRSMAMVMSETFVSQQLRSPSTADYPGLSDAGVDVRHVGGCEFQIRSYVDAQNAFGATVRSRYRATMVYNPDGGSWTARSLSID